MSCVRKEGIDNLLSLNKITVTKLQKDNRVVATKNNHIDLYPIQSREKAGKVEPYNYDIQLAVLPIFQGRQRRC